MHNGEDSGLAITKAEYYVILSPGFCKKEHQYAVQHEGNWYNGKINIVRVDALKRFIDYYNKTGNIRHVSKGQSVGYEILIRKMDDAIWFGNCPITLNNNPSTGSFVDEFDLTQIEYNTNFSIKQVDKAANKIF
jgi:hypothetical protein